jgi:apoptosis regulator BAX
MMDLQHGGRALRPVDIGNQARGLLVQFIEDRLRVSNPYIVVDENLLLSPEAPRGPELQHARAIGSALRIIGDELDGNLHLQELIEKTTMLRPDDVRQSFFNVAREIFSDGVYNWGRIVMLFYFAFKLVVKAVSNKLFEILKKIVEWVVQFIVDSAANWIIERGGWEAIQEHFGATKVQIAGVILSAIVVCAFIYWRSSK